MNWTKRDVRRLSVSLALAAGLLGSSAACSEEGANETATEEDAPSGTVVGSASEATAFASLADWVTYADFVAVVTVESADEAESPEWASDDAPGGVVNRSIRLRVDQALFQSTEVPATIDVTDIGWIESDDGLAVRREYYPEHGVRFEVGKSYVGAFFKDPSGAYSLWTSSSLFPLDGGKIVKGGGPDGGPAARLVGQTPEQIRALLKTQRPLPLPPEAANLNPIEQQQLVLAAEARKDEHP